MLSSNETATVFAMLSCAHVAGVTAEQLRARGFDGGALPSFNYAPELGLYVIQRQVAPAADEPKK